MKKSKFQVYCNNALCVIALLCSFLIFLLNFIYSAEIAYDITEVVTVSRTVIRGIVMGFVALLTVFALSVIIKKIERVEPKILFLIFSLLYSLAAIYLISNVDTQIRSDALSVYKAAVNYSAGNYRYFVQGGYIHSYPHQVGMMSYHLILQIFSNKTVFVFIVNFFLVMGINYVNYKMSVLIFDNKFVSCITILLSFAFLPQFFFILFAYSLIPSFFFMILSMYNAMRFVKLNSKKALVATVIFLCFSIILKKNCLIGAVAIIIYIIIASTEKICVKTVAVLSAAACIVLPLNLLIGYFENVTGENLDNGVPSIMWLAMGTDLDNKDRAPGWYNGFNYYTYIDQGHDSESAEAIGKEKLKNNIEKIKKSPAEAIEFFKIKTVSQWCESTYQSLWSGPLEDCDQHTHTKLLRSLYNGEKAENIFAVFCEFITQSVWSFALVFLIMYRKQYDGWQLVFLFFIGGLLFHTLWEGKSQYIYPYFFCIIPFASYAVFGITGAIQKNYGKYMQKIKKRSKDKT